MCNQKLRICLCRYGLQLETESSATAMNAGRWTSAFSRQAASKHLFVLQRAGLVSLREQGREVLYQVEASDSPDGQ